MGLCPEGGLPIEIPLELEKRAVCILLECFLAMRKFEGLRFGCIYSSSERLDFFQWLPESARYDMARGQVDKAYATLERIARDNGKPMPLGRLVDQTHTSYTPVRPPQRCSQFTSTVANIAEINNSFLRVLNWWVAETLVFSVCMRQSVGFPLYCSQLNRIYRSFLCVV